MGGSSTDQAPESLSLKQRLNRAIVEFSRQLAVVKSGALVQVWMPEQCSDGTTVLSAQGLPFAVVGVGDLLALFRCVSVRYRFSTDITRPSLMGAIGRVFATMEPEMSRDVQKYDKQVYLRVSEAQRCRVHSSLMVPVFEVNHMDKPLAVLELVQSDKDIVFPQVMSWLADCLKSVSLTTVTLEDHNVTSAGELQHWPMLVDQGLLPGRKATEVPSTAGGPLLTLPAPQGAPGLADDSSAPMAISRDRLDDMSDEAAAAAEMSGEREMPPPNRGSSAALDAKSWEHVSSISAPPNNLMRQSSSSGQGAMGDNSPSSAAHMQQSSGNTGSAAQPSTTPGVGGAGASGGSAPAGGQEAQVQALMSLLSANGVNPALVPNLKQLLGSALEPSAGAQQPQQQQTAAPSAPAQSGTSTAQLHQALATILANSGTKGGSNARSGGTVVKSEPGDNDGDDVGSDGDDDLGSDDDESARGNRNRVDGGAGKRLRFEDLQAQFGLGLKEAAANLGICATTLKRACRRHGIKRWPRRQIVKLSKALTQMGYSGVPPPDLVQSAATGQLAVAPEAAAAAAAQVAQAAQQPAPSPLTTAQQQQQQLATLLATGNAPSQPRPAGATKAATAQAPLHPLLAALAQQVVQQQQQSAGSGAQQAPAAASTPSSQPSNPGMQPPLPAGMPQPPQQQGGMMGPGNMMMPMLPLLNQQGGMGVLPNMMMHPAALQHAFMQQAMAMGLMPGMMPPPPPPAAAPPGAQPPPSSTAQSQPQPPGPPSGVPPMTFMYGHGMMSTPASSAMVPALVHELDGSSGAAAMQTSASGMLGPPGMSKTAFDMPMNNSNHSIPTGELLHGLDTLLLGTTEQNRDAGLNSEAQMQAIHTLFMKDATSFDNFMEMLSDDLPVIQ